MGLLNAVYMKFRAFILFIERTDEEFLAGEVGALRESAATQAGQGSKRRSR